MAFEALNIKDVKLELGQAVKSLRKKNKVSQLELAESLELSRLTIQKLESGNNFTIDTLLKILQHFELLDQLHEGIKQAVKSNEQIDALY